MKEYKAYECWNIEELESTLNRQAKEGFELKFYHCHRDGNVTNEKHFIVMEKERGKNG